MIFVKTSQNFIKISQISVAYGMYGHEDRTLTKITGSFLILCIERICCIGKANTLSTGAFQCFGIPEFPWTTPCIVCIPVKNVTAISALEKWPRRNYHFSIGSA